MSEADAVGDFLHNEMVEQFCALTGKRERRGRSATVVGMARDNLPSLAIRSNNLQSPLPPGASEQIARATLEAAAWNIDFAVNMHMDSQSEEPMEAAPVVVEPPEDRQTVQQGPATATSSTSTSNNNRHNQPTSSTVSG